MDKDNNKFPMVVNHVVKSNTESPVIKDISIREMFKNLDDMFKEYWKENTNKDLASSILNKDHDTRILGISDVECIKILKNFYCGVYSIDRLVAYCGLPREDIYKIIKDDREIDYSCYNLFRADDINWELSPYETTMYAKYNFLELEYEYNKPNNGYKICLSAPRYNLDDKAYTDSDGNLHFTTEILDMQHLLQEPINDKIDILEDDASEFSVLRIAITRDLFDMIPKDWLHDTKEFKNYLCSNEKEIDFLENAFCIDTDKLIGYDYIRFIIKEKKWEIK